MREQPFILDAAAPGESLGAETLRFTLDLPAAGLPVEVRVCGEGTLADLVPPARRLADQIVRRTVARSAHEGNPSACRKGCGGCCRFLVSLSVPEVFRMKQEFDALPPRRRAHVARAFLAAGRALTQNPPPALAQPQGAAPSAHNLQAISQWYASLNLACPLLQADLCTNYAQRPLACREHIALCGASDGKTACPGSRPLPLPASVHEALGAVAAELEGLPLESVALPLALNWLDIHDARRPLRRWPMKTLAIRFFAALNDMLRRNLAAA